MTRTATDDLALVSAIIDGVEARLTGSDEAVVLDAEPGRRFSAGVLNATRAKDRAQTNRRPDSTGFSARFRRAAGEPIRVTISFSIYYRVRPTFEEQTSRGAGSVADDQIVVGVPKYRRLDRLVSGVIQVPDVQTERLSVDARPLND